jgi:hypothetical protein
VAAQEALVVVKDVSPEDDSLFARFDGNPDADLPFETNDGFVARHGHREVGSHVRDGHGKVEVLGFAPAHECI